MIRIYETDIVIYDLVFYMCFQASDAQKMV